MKKTNKLSLQKLYWTSLAFFCQAGVALAQLPEPPIPPPLENRGGGFGAPPTLLPLENENIGGSSDYCIGLADMIRTGRIHLWNLPCFVKYFTQTLIALSGSIAVVYVMIGGYQYIIGSDEKKADAKKTIQHALIGLAVSLMAWILVDLVLTVATE